MAIYWINDNIQILSQLKLFKADSEFWGKMAMLAWWFGLVFDLIRIIRTYKELGSQYSYYSDFVKKHPDKFDAHKEHISSLKKQQKTCLLDVVKTIGDLFTATKGSGLADRFGLKWIDDVWCGAGGSVSALIFLYQTYK
jgi:Peroxisomal biogenesis factor 11 (PEX11)